MEIVKTSYKDKDGVWQPIPFNYAKEEKMEYKLLIEERSKAFEIQKKLNQWKHEYLVSVVAMSPVGEDSLAILIQREKKEERRKGDGC
jgi:hypothetical protein